MKDLVGHPFALNGYKEEKELCIECATALPL
jgi:hypothetical protein